VQHDFAAERPRTASTFRRGVVTGITISARQPSRRAASATPVHGIPAEATDDASPELLRVEVAAILLYAPRQLEAEHGLAVLALQSTWLDRRLDTAARRLERRLAGHVVAHAR
jgi:hypothetical protein